MVPGCKPEWKREAITVFPDFLACVHCKSPDLLQPSLPLGAYPPQGPPQQQNMTPGFVWVRSSGGEKVVGAVEGGSEQGEV